MQECTPVSALVTLACLLQNNCQDANIVGCTFTNNTAQQGPVLFLNNSVPNITGSTFNGSATAGDQVFDNSMTPSPAEGSEGDATSDMTASGAPTEEVNQNAPVGGGVINSGR